VGHDADIVIWNPNSEFLVDANTLQHRHKISPYNGESLHGVVQKTFLRGKKIYDEAHFWDAKNGRLLIERQ